MIPSLDELTRQCLNHLHTYPSLIADPAFFRRAKRRVARLKAGGLEDSLWPDMTDDERHHVHLMYRHLQSRLEEA